jgi:hypothetical protein
VSRGHHMGWLQNVTRLSSGGFLLVAREFTICNRCCQRVATINTTANNSHYSYPQLRQGTNEISSLQVITTFNEAMAMRSN